MERRDADDSDATVVARLFAGLERTTRDGRAEQRLPLDEAGTVAALFEALGLDGRAAGLVLVNGLHAGDATRLKPGDEVAIFPPLGGG